MVALEMTLTHKGIYVLVEYSLANRIEQILQTIDMCIDNKVFAVGLRHMRKRFYVQINNNSDLFRQENRKLVKDIYKFLKYRTTWEEDFVFDYGYYWELNSGRYPLPEVDAVLNKMNDIIEKLEEIIRLDYKKMKKENMEFAEDLAKYVFKPDRLKRFSQDYGLDNFGEYLDILD
jgi:hypothetical protein